MFSSLISNQRHGLVTQRNKEEKATVHSILPIRAKLRLVRPFIPLVLCYKSHLGQGPESHRLLFLMW